MRGMVRENIVTPANFIYPLFIHDEDFNQPIPSMPGCERHSLDSMLREVGESYELGVKTFVLFPKVPDELKTNLGVEAYNPNGIVPRAIRMIKENYPDATVVTDVALDPYSDQGHDGVVEDGKILNDVTINQLCKQVVCQARAGADIVAPSDMMVSLKNKDTKQQSSLVQFTSCDWQGSLVLIFSLFIRPYCPDNRTDVSRPSVML
jgi:porphobilinogen synthase